LDAILEKECDYPTDTKPDARPRKERGYRGLQEVAMTECSQIDLEKASAWEEKKSKLVFRGCKKGRAKNCCEGRNARRRGGDSRKN